MNYIRVVLLSKRLESLLKIFHSTVRNLEGDLENFIKEVDGIY
jgi:hypothetical protein